MSLRWSNHALARWDERFSGWHPHERTRLEYRMVDVTQLRAFLGVADQTVRAWFDPKTEALLLVAGGKHVVTVWLPDVPGRLTLLHRVAAGGALAKARAGRSLGRRSSVSGR